tara:strand:+ start:512 stop:1375 length:864 start_codon:yes stop_codon:yes gene_type:complete
MANIKFSQFTAEADIANFDDIVGYAGAVNTRITPANLASSLITLSGGPYVPIAGGTMTGTLLFNTGAASNIVISGDLSDGSSVGAQWETLAVNRIAPASGVEWLQNYQNPQIGYKAFQSFQWTSGNPVPYTNWTNGVASDLPFDPGSNPGFSGFGAIQATTITSGGTGNFLWFCTNAAGGTATEEATFTLGGSGDGTWKVRTCQHWFDQTNQVEIRVSFNINGTLIDVIDEKSTELSGDKIFYGELVQTFAANDTLSVNVEFVSGGVNPFPSAAGNRPIEITFERIV